MTLPEYRPVANPERERTIAREGERGGMDVVVEFPETRDEEEERREEHMQTLYEIRLARVAVRDERRNRREARRRGDRVPSSSSTRQQTGSGGVNSLLNPDADDSSATPSIRPTVAAAVASRSASSLAALIAEPPARVSQVQYGEIGTARADGSRVRARSDASESDQLLSSAASMGLHSRQESAASSIRTTYTGPNQHPQSTHNRSASTLSISTTADDLANGPGGRRSQDLGDMRPPGYERHLFGGEEAPASCPGRARGPGNPPPRGPRRR